MTDDKLHLAKLQKGSMTFEVVIEPDKAIAFHDGKDVDIRECLKSEEIFSDAKKGMVSPEHAIEQTFGTTDALAVAKTILKEGKIQVTSEYREGLRQEKYRRIVNMIHRQGVDPKTNLPHPVTRVENAFKEASIKIDEYKPAEDQLQDILKQLRVILPIKFVTKEIAVKVPADYAAKSYPIVKGFGKFIREDWQSDGSWLVVLEIPGGMESELYDKLNNMTHGTVETKVINTK